MKKIVLAAGLVSALALAACGDNTELKNSTSTTQVLDNGTAVVTNTTTVAKH